MPENVVFFVKLLLKVHKTKSEKGEEDETKK